VKPATPLVVAMFARCKSHIPYWLPGYATPILYAGGIVLKTAQRMVFVKIISNYIKIKMIKKLGEDQIK